MRARAGGLTLVELVVAIAVFTIIAAAAYAGLISVLEARDHAERRAERLAAVQYAVDALGEDVRETVARAVRTDIRGEGHAVTGGPDGRDVLLVTRGGWPNPADLDRGNLLRVHWQLEDDTLQRSWRDRLDAVVGTPETRRTMLEDVDDVAVRFLGGDGEWRDDWPEGAPEQAADEVPRAIEVTLELGDWGEIERLFAIAPGARAPMGAVPGAGDAEGP